MIGAVLCAGSRPAGGLRRRHPQLGCPMPEPLTLEVFSDYI
jgi:hypothetical protein